MSRAVVAPLNEQWMASNPASAYLRIGSTARTRMSRSHNPLHMNNARYMLNRMWLKSGFPIRICVAIAPPGRLIVSTAPSSAVRGIR